jgi:hypothetical protein
MQRRTFTLAIPAVLTAAHTLARAQAFPSKPIRYIVPVAAGGGSDMVGRVVTERWGRLLNQTFVVDNQGGGGGVIAAQSTARAPADGYTLMQGYVATHGTSPATRKLPYDPIKDFTPIGMIGATPNVLVINADVPAKDFKEFLAYVRANPGKVSYGSAGPGSLTHLTMELFKQVDRRADDARALPRRRAGLQRPHGRPDAGDVPGPGRRGAAHQVGPRAPAGHHRQGAPSAAQGRADARGARPATASTRCSGTAWWAPPACPPTWCASSTIR